MSYVQSRLQHIAYDNANINLQNVECLVRSFMNWGIIMMKQTSNINAKRTLLRIRRWRDYSLAHSCNPELIPGFNACNSMSI